MWRVFETLNLSLERYIYEMDLLTTAQRVKLF